MMQVKRLLLMFISFSVIISCSKDVTKEDEPVIIAEELKLSEVKILSSLNNTTKIDIDLKHENGSWSAVLPKDISSSLILSFSTNASKVSVGQVAQESGITKNDFSKELEYVLENAKGEQKKIKIHISFIHTSVPHISIVTDGNVEVTSKDYYLKASINIDGSKIYEDFSGTTEIKGRGNSTWQRPKKPYRLKLTSKASILGLPAAKNWVLLANHLDASLMCNTIAMRVGRDLAVPYTNDIIPVDLTINGKYRGSYTLTQQIEVDENRVNVGKDGYLLELDSYFDEDYQFKSASYNLPVMIKSPELTATSQITPIKTDFETFESLVASNTFPNNDYANQFDIDVLAKYVLVYFLTGNEEINHPKSIYLNKKIGGKFTFGPIWDFDWAYGYESGAGHFTNPTRPLFWTGTQEKVGSKFFKRLLEDPKVKLALKNHWQVYKRDKFDNLLLFVDEYAGQIKESKNKDEAVWKIGKSFEQEVVKLKSYLKSRAAYIDQYVGNL